MANPRQDLANALTDAGVEFPSSATTQQLRNLLQSVVGVTANTYASTANISDNEESINDAPHADAVRSADADLPAVAVPTAVAAYTRVCSITHYNAQRTFAVLAMRSEMQIWQYCKCIAFQNAIFVSNVAHYLQEKF